MSKLLELRRLSKQFIKGEAVIDVMKDIRLSLDNNERIAIMGESGAGKSTLLQIMGGLLAPTDGEVLVNGHSLYALPDTLRSQFRNNHIGFVFQFHYLLPEFTALENVCMPPLIRNAKFNKDRARELLEKVGLSHRLHHKPAELSGGEQQRVAIARALMMSPEILLADEPTGNLDTATSDRVAEVLFELTHEEGALILVTHSERLAQKADKVYRLTKGELIGG